MGEYRQQAKDAFWNNVIPANSPISNSDCDDAIDAILDAACEETLGVMEAKFDNFERGVIAPIREMVREIRAELDALKAGSPPSEKPLGHTVGPSNPCKYSCLHPGNCMEREQCAEGSGHVWDHARRKWSKNPWISKPSPELDGKTAWDALHPSRRQFAVFCWNPRPFTACAVHIAESECDAKQKCEQYNVYGTYYGRYFWAELPPL